MHIAFLYNLSEDDPANFAEDDDPASSPVVAALRRLGHEVTPIACTLDLTQLRIQLDRLQPDVAFNRVESLGGSDALASAAAMLLEAMGLPYTGCPAESLVAAAGKISTKQRLIEAGLPTPEWVDADFTSSISIPSGNARFIIKSVYEHASFEMDDTCVVGPATRERVAEEIRKRSASAGKPFFAERYIEGREFNLSLLGNAPDVLPPAEIDFSAFPTDKPRIVGFGAKWNDASFEFHNTPRRFDFAPTDSALIEQLKELAVKCWRLFGLRGYARVDFRVDEAGQPWILEINTNPCIAPTSGFAAALEQAGLSYDEGIQRIIQAALPPDRSLGSKRQPWVVTTSR
jgi:D-alanine-D-alanine ligase